MGGTESKQSVEVLQTTVNETINKTLNETNNSAECKSETNQTMKVNMDNVKMRGKSKLKVGQTTEVNMSCFVSNVNGLATNIKRDLQTEYGSETDLESILTKSGFTLGSDTNETHQKVEQYLNNKLVNEVENVINNAVSADQSASQTLIFNVGNLDMGDEADFELSQSAIIEVIAENISSNMIDTLLDETNTVIAETKNTGKTDTKISGMGDTTTSIVASIVGGLSCMFFSGIMGFVVYNGTNKGAKLAADPGFQRFAMNLTPQGRAMNTLGSIQGAGAKKLFNKTTFLVIILIFLLYIAYRLN